MIASLRTGTVGHNGSRIDFLIGCGGLKQAGIGREGGQKSCAPFLDAKTIILTEAPAQLTG
jgi:aldehyde dehydrogenase (NAD+)